MVLYKFVLFMEGPTDRILGFAAVQAEAILHSAHMRFLFWVLQSMNRVNKAAKENLKKSK